MNTINCTICNKEIPRKESSNNCCSKCYHQHYYETNKLHHKSMVAKYQSHRHNTDVNWQTAHNMRRSLRSFLKLEVKSSFIEKYTGCSQTKLRNHIESLFDNKMNWKNYGEWQIDFIVPCKKFDLTTEEGKSECFNYLNLRPMWKDEKLSKTKTTL